MEILYRTEQLSIMSKVPIDTKQRIIRFSMLCDLVSFDKNKTPQQQQQQEKAKASFAILFA